MLVCCKAGFLKALMALVKREHKRSLWAWRENDRRFQVLGLSGV